MGETGSFYEIRINEIILTEQFTGLIQSIADPPANLRYLNGMRQPRPIEIVFTREEDLGLTLQSPECCRVDDAITIYLKTCPILIIPWRGSLGIKGLAVECVVERIIHGF